MISTIISKARKEGRKALTEFESKEILRAYGIPTTYGEIATSPDEAVKIAEKIKYPVALKIISPQILHKSDAGGVKLNLKSPEEVKSAFKEIIKNAKAYNPKAEIIGVFVQEMASPTIREIIVGGTREPQFGPVVMLGLGGIFVEVLRDVSFRLAPIEEIDAYEMIEELKGKKIFGPFRGMPKVDIKNIVDVLLAVSKLITEQKEISELDINPIMVYPNEVKAVDARIILV
ncbi:MAG TPA: acetyl-CoA synthetase [Candidatus Bathyarchaeota archaeon]|nr:acetyl-CoA synthetase [Candidatus Bathyarchaeota archaeon]HEX69420.1 acetyl-CoA synthetase [Candidatus Bathyarchaeota archaeon]